MAVSQAKLEANRRNGARSKGPVSQAGKDRSRLNSVTHGLRAKTPVLLDEDPQALADRMRAWTASLSPCDDVEQRAVDDAVTYSWLQDRARRAQVARINANILNYGVDDAKTTAHEVDDLGERLFKDRMGPLMLYPSATFGERGDIGRDPSASYAGPKADDPDRPAAIVLSLQSTLPGCEWMIGEWARLKAVLDEGQAWVPSDKLKATRLLGKQPFDVIDERDVALVYMASFVLKPDRESWWWEIAMELSKKDTMRFRKCAAVRELDSLQPENASKAREVLLGIIERATARVTVKADAHRERALAMAALVPDILAFDDSKEGEYLRRQELATGRGIARSLDTLYKHRRAPAARNEDEVPDCVTNELAVSENVMSEPYDVGENVTSEPNDVARLELGVSQVTPNPIDSPSLGAKSPSERKNPFAERKATMATPQASTRLPSTVTCT